MCYSFSEGQKNSQHSTRAIFTGVGVKDRARGSLRGEFQGLKSSAPVFQPFVSECSDSGAKHNAVDLNSGILPWQLRSLLQLSFRRLMLPQETKRDHAYKDHNSSEARCLS